MSESTRTPPPLLVERFLSGTLNDAEHAAFMAATNEEQRARLRAEHEALSAELLRARTPAAFAREVRARATRGRAVHEKPILRALLFAALIAVAAFVGRDALRELDRNAAREQERIAPTESERAKGLAPSLRVYRKGPHAPQLLAYGQHVQAGDVLQLGYVAAGMSHAVLLSIDGGGQVTLHFPVHAEASTKLAAAQGEQLLPSAYELDDAPRFERFVLVTSRRPLRTGELLRAARQLSRPGVSALDAPLSLPAHAQQVSVLLNKADP